MRNQFFACFSQSLLINKVEITKNALIRGGEVILNLKNLWANVKKSKVFHISQFAYAFVFMPLVFAVGVVEFDPTSLIRLDPDEQSSILLNEVSISASEPVFIIDNGMTEVTLLVGEQKKTFLTRAQTIGEALSEQNIKFEGHLIVPSPETLISGPSVTVEFKSGIQAIVTDEGKEYNIETINTDAKKIALDAGLEVYPEDKASFLPLLEDLVIRVKIERATPVYYSDAGVVKVARTWAKTIQEFLDEKGIELIGADSLSLDPNQPISANLEIIVTRFSDKEVTEQQEIPYGTNYENDSSMDKGTSQTVQEGSNGLKDVTYRVSYRNNEETGRVVISEKILKDAVPKIVKVGTKVPYNPWNGYNFGGGVEQWRSLLSQYDWPIEQALLVISKESGGNPYAVSRTQDYGLWQIHMGLQYYGDRIFDPAFNTQLAYQKYIGRGRTWTAWYAVRGILW